MTEKETPLLAGVLLMQLSKDNCWSLLRTVRSSLSK